MGWVMRGPFGVLNGPMHSWAPPYCCYRTPCQTEYTHKITAWLLLGNWKETKIQFVYRLEGNKINFLKIFVLVKILGWLVEFSLTILTNLRADHQTIRYSFYIPHIHNTGKNTMSGPVWTARSQTPESLLMMIPW